MAAFTSVLCGCGDRAAEWWGCSKSLVVAEQSGGELRRQRQRKRHNAAPCFINKVDFSCQRHDFVYFGTSSLSEEPVVTEREGDRAGRTDRALHATHSRLSSHHSRLASDGLPARLGADLWSVDKRKETWLCGRMLQLVTVLHSGWDGACGVWCCLRRFHLIDCLGWIHIAELLLLDSPSQTVRFLNTAYEKAQRMMEYRATVAVLLLLSALTSLAYGKFKVACAWLLWVMFAQMEPVLHISGSQN